MEKNAFIGEEEAPEFRGEKKDIIMPFDIEQLQKNNKIYDAAYFGIFFQYLTRSSVGFP